MRCDVCDRPTGGDRCQREECAAEDHGHHPHPTAPVLAVAGVDPYDPLPLEGVDDELLRLIVAQCADAANDNAADTEKSA